MASPNGNPNANPNNLNSPSDVWMQFSPTHNLSPPMASPARNPNLNLNNPNLPFDIGMPFLTHSQLLHMASLTGNPNLNLNNPNLPFNIGIPFSPPHNQLPAMASPAGDPDLNPNNPNLPFDTGVLFSRTHNPMPTAVSMYPGAAGQSWLSLSSPGIYHHTTYSFHHGPYLRYPEDPQPPMPRPDIFPMANSNTNPIWSSNPTGPYLRYAQDLQIPVPRPAISFPMPNPNQSGNTSWPHQAQGLQNPIPHPVTSFPMPNRRANPNRSATSGATPKHREGAQEHITISDDESDSEVFFDDTPTNSKSNGKASSGSLKTGGKASSFSEAGKGGKSFSAGKGGKASTSNAKPAKSDAELKLELDMPPNSRILMDCEASEMLQKIHEHMAILSEDPKIKIPECFDKAFQYAKDGNHFTAAKSVKEILQPLKKHGVTDGEICMIANIGPETIEEVYALVPSLKATRSRNEGPIREALASLGNIKASK